MVYVITCGDEGVQINEGTRLAFAGAGLKLPGFSEAVKILKKLLDKDLRIVASAENDWTKKQFELSNWDQVNATMQQHVEALADKEKLLYSGYLPFADPKALKHEIKGHMVRPQKVHIANKICFTLGGGEQTYNLGNYMISAEWVGQADKKLVKEMMQTQIEHYTAVAGGQDLQIVFEKEGTLDEKIIAANEKMLKSVGIE